MLIIALVLALIGLVALVFAVVTSNELVAWVCIGASVVGVVLLIIDALQERQRRDAGAEEHGEGHQEGEAPHEGSEEGYVDYPEEVPEQGAATDASETSEEAEGTQESTVSAEGRGDDATK